MRTGRRLWTETVPHSPFVKTAILPGGKTFVAAVREIRRTRLLSAKGVSYAPFPCTALQFRDLWTGQFRQSSRGVGTPLGEVIALDVAPSGQQVVATLQHGVVVWKMPGTSSADSGGRWRTYPLRIQDSERSSVVGAKFTADSRFVVVTYRKPSSVRRTTNGETRQTTAYAVRADIFDTSAKTTLAPPVAILGPWRDQSGISGALTPDRKYLIAFPSTAPGATLTLWDVKTYQRFREIKTWKGSDYASALQFLPLSYGLSFAANQPNAYRFQFVTGDPMDNSLVRCTWDLQANEIRELIVSQDLWYLRPSGPPFPPMGSLWQSPADLPTVFSRASTV